MIKRKRIIEYVGVNENTKDSWRRIKTNFTNKVFLRRYGKGRISIFVNGGYFNNHSEEEFLKEWDILDRRVLVEKTGFCI